MRLRLLRETITGQNKQFDVGMVYVLPAQFWAKQTKQPELGQGPEVKVIGPVGSHPTERASDCPITEGIQVLGPETPSEIVTLTRPPINMLNHVRPLYVRATLDGIPVSKVLVDNGAAINILPVATMKKLGKDSHDLVPTDVLVSSFVDDITTTRGILPLNVGVGRQITLSAFFVIESRASYNALLGRDWIHAAACLPSSMHQALILWGQTGPEVIAADPSPFQAEARAVEAFYYVQGVGPHRFEGIDKYGCPMQATMTHRITITEMRDIATELDRPKNGTARRPLELQCKVEEVDED